MNAPQFTPGPWFVHQAFGTDLFFVKRQDGDRTLRLDPESGKFARADARLIAAAPEMFEALVAIHNMLWGRPDIVNALRPLMGFAEDAISDQCAAALAKARGER